MPRWPLLALAPLLMVARPGEAQFGGACESWMAITQAPTDPYYQNTAVIVVAWGETITEDPPCIQGGMPYGFQFTVNGVNVTSYFTFNPTGDGASGTVTLPNGFVTLVASVQGVNAAGETITLTDTRTTTVNPGGGGVPMAPSLVDVQSVNPGSVIERDLCLTIAAGSDAAYECGDLRIVHALPSVRTLNRVRTPTLIYSSAHANPWPLLQANVTQPAGASVPDSVVAVLYVNGSYRTRSRFGGLPAGRTTRIAIGFKGISDPTGVYSYTLEVTNWYGSSPYPASTPATGQFIVVNRASSPFGAGWWLAGFEQLNPATKLWVGGDGSARVYQAAGANVWVAASVDRPDTLKWDGTYYVRYLPHGVQVRFNSAGQHVATVDRLGHQTVFGYEAANLRSINLPPAGSGLTYYFNYNGAGGALGSITAPLWYATPTLTYGRLVSIRDADNTVVSFGYDATMPNRIVSRTDRRGTVTTYAFDAGSKVVSASVAMGSGQAPIVTAFENPAETDGLTGLDTADVYTRLNGPRTDVTDYTWFWVDRFGAPQRIKDAVEGETRLWRTDGMWPAAVTRMVRYLSSDSQVIRATYDNMGLVATVTDSSTCQGGACALTRYQYDARWGFVTKIVPPMGDSVVISYDPATGNRLWQQDARGASSRMTFGYGNAQCRVLTSIQRPLASGRDSLGYDSRFCNLSETRSPLNQWETSSLDGVGRVVATVRSNSVRDTIAYDPMGRDTLRITSGPFNSVTLNEWNGGTSYFYLPWPAESVFVRTRYDEESNRMELHRRGSGQAAWLVTTWAYDRANRVVRERAPDLAVDSFAYDPAGHQTLWRTRRGHDVTMAYDAAGRLTRRTVPAVTYGQETFETKTFPQQAVYGSSLTIAADTALFGYDLAGNLLFANNRDALVSRSYNRNGTVASETQRIRTYTGTDFSQHVYLLTFTYDLNGRRATMTHPAALRPSGAGPTQYRYNEWGPVDTLVAPGGQTFRFSYDLEGRLDSIVYPNQMRQVHGYNADGQLFRQRSVSLMGSSSGFTNGVARDDSLFYSRGWVATVRGSGGEVHQFIRTGLGHLGFAEEAVGPLVRLREWWRPDALGNVNRHWRMVDANGFSEVDSSIYAGTTLRLLQNASFHAPPTGGQWWWLSPAVYDPAGNEHLMTRYRQGAYCGWGDDLLCADQRSFYYQEAYARYYAADNRLRVVDRRTNTSAASTYAGGIEEFRYDALGRRVWRRFRGDGFYVSTNTVLYLNEMVRYVWDGDQVLYEIRASGATGQNPEADNTSDRLFGRVMYVHGPAIDRPLYVQRADPYWGELFLHPDWRGRLTAGSWPAGWNDASLDASIQLVYWPARRTSSYGERRSRFQDADPAVNRPWMGSFLDSQRDGTEQVYLRNRYYDPVSGRFTQEDPIGLAGGLNLYGFANGDPVTFSDPFGLCPNGVGSVSARGGPGNTVIVVCEDGSEDVRSGGTRSWRNSNPGNIEAGGFSQRQGAIGAAGGTGNNRFAVFADEAGGQQALMGLLQTRNYQSLTVAGAIARWAPSNENDTQAYQQAVEKATGLSGTRSMNSLSAAELEAVAAAIRRHEGWSAGTVTNRGPQQQ